MVVNVTHISTTVEALSKHVIDSGSRRLVLLLWRAFQPALLFVS